MKALRFIAGAHFVFAALFAGLAIYLASQHTAAFEEVIIFTVWHGLTGWRLRRGGWGARISSAFLHLFYGLIFGFGAFGGGETSWKVRIPGGVFAIYAFWAFLMVLIPEDRTPGEE